MVPSDAPPPTRDRAPVAQKVLFQFSGKALLSGIPRRPERARLRIASGPFRLRSNSRWVCLGCVWSWIRPGCTKCGISTRTLRREYSILQATRWSYRMFRIMTHQHGLVIANGDHTGADATLPFWSRGGTTPHHAPAS